jgi:hypothetical protein
MTSAFDCFDYEPVSATQGDEFRDTTMTPAIIDIGVAERAEGKCETVSLLDPIAGRVMPIKPKDVPFVVVQCPSPSEASFLARWLTAATEADFLQTRLRRDDPPFDKAIERLRCHYDVEFSPAAMAFVRLWLTSGAAFSLSLFDSEWAEPFTYMVAAGFFMEVDNHYEMTQPRVLTSDVIARGLLRLAATEDQDYVLHPEWLLTTMTKQAARRTVKMIKRRAAYG